MKKKGNIGVMKQSKSASDITQGTLDRKDDFRCFQSRLGSRSSSHDSIFLSKLRQSDPEPPWVLSQENVHGKIQALQMKLQMQKLHLGPPPRVLPVKQSEDHQHPTEVLALSKNLPHESQLKSSSQGVFPHPVSPPQPPFYSSAPSPGIDFSTLPQFIPCLDNSAARHRMSVKPRNQRASTKSRRMSTSDRSRPRSESMIILERPLIEHKEEDGIDVTKEMTRVRSYSSQIIRPGKGLITPPTKSPCPASPLKLLVGSDVDSHPCSMSQCKGNYEPAESKTADVGTKQILKSAEEMVVKCPSSAGPTGHKGSEDHKETLYSSKLKGVEGSVMSTVSSAYSLCLISLGTEQSQPETDKELNTVTTHVKGNALNRNKVQDTLQESYFKGQPLKPLSLHRNTSPLDSKSVGKNAHQISVMPLSSEKGCLQESTTQQRSLSFSVSSDKSHERQRTASFTGQMEQTGGNQELVFPFIKPSSNLKMQDPDKNAQVKPTGKDSSQTRAISTPADSTQPRDLTITVSVGQERRDSPSNKTRDMAIEDRVEDVHRNIGLKLNKDSKEQKEESSASEVKLHTTYLSEFTDKQHITEVGSAPRLPKSTTSKAVDQNDSKVGPVRETVLRSPQLYNTKLFITAESPEFSSKRPQSARRDQERPGLNRFADLPASAHLPGSTIDITMSTPATFMEKSPLQTSAKESKEAFTELSWMTMAREKTRSLQQLFTSTLNDLAGLQTATRPAASPLTQISSQPSTGPIKPKHQVPSAQPTVSPPESHLPPVHAFGRATQPPTLKSSISLAQQSIDQSGGVEFSLKQTLSQTNQIQPTYLSGRPGQMSTNSATKSVQSTGIYMPSTQIMHPTPQQLSEMSIPHAHPIQQTLSQNVSKPQTSLCLSLSPKLTPHQPTHQSPSPLSQHRSLGENVSSLPLGQVDWTSMSQGKSPTESRAQYAVGTQALLAKQWHHQKPDAVKVVDQNSTPDSQTYQALDEFLTISRRSKFTELAVSPRPMRLDREVKWQKKSLPPPSPPSSRLQSNSDSRQPFWMELAKRKSMAWSDKTMD
ncbi:mucin-4 isoform X1 [Hemibagrus wyckioides]|uniref:mucin-4 isoform X1 n=1 Tax=Hemibagrus wyckioides TaxID=337641 RepID=UPI00266BBB50|nr:mucin-4 isoform X1 [Hemibagrus wyckioides]